MNYETQSTCIEFVHCTYLIALGAGAGAGVGNLGLASELTSGASYDIFVRAWGPGGFSTGGTVAGVEAYGVSAAPFVYTP